MLQQAQARYIFPPIILALQVAGTVVFSALAIANLASHGRQGAVYGFFAAVGVLGLVVPLIPVARSEGNRRGARVRDEFTIPVGTDPAWDLVLETLGDLFGTPSVTREGLRAHSATSTRPRSWRSWGEVLEVEVRAHGQSGSRISALCSPIGLQVTSLGACSRDLRRFRQVLQWRASDTTP